MRLRVLLALAAVLALVAAACGGDDDDTGATPTDDPVREADDGGGDVPDGCAGDPSPVSVQGGEALPGVDGPTFEPTDAIVAQQPIVLDPDGELGLEDISEAAAEAELIAYTVYLADFPLSEADASRLRFADPPPGGTFFAFSVVPPTEEPITTGDVIRGGRPEFESTTTFGTVGTQYGTSVVEDAPLLSLDDDDGEVEVLHLDDERICLAWSQAGTLFGGTSGAWSIEAVIAGDLAPRGTVPLS